MRTPRRLPRPAQPDSVTRFFEVIADPRDRAMFLLMLRCGLRISEVAQLELKDLFLAEDFPRLVVQGKGAKERSVYLSAQAARALNAWLDARPMVADAHVFVSHRGERLSTTAIHLRLMHYREASGVRFSAHHLRHTFANDLLAAEVPVTSIQKLLGHAWLETTQTYVTANDRQVQADLAAAAAHLEGWQ
jgi:site-specific recombinase XerC